MKTLIIILTFILTAQNTSSQIFLYFDWDQNPVTQASQGPDATAVSSSAISSNNGVNGSNGLNPGLPKKDLDMIVPGSAANNPDGIDIQIDFQRDESVGDFVTRNGFVFGMNNGYVYVSFRVKNGYGGYVTVNSGNVYSIPNDDNFRTYRFFYLPDLGNAELQVNGTTVWSYNGTAGRDMYWIGGNYIIGDNMDGSGSNKTILDNLIMASVTASPLPVELISFDGTPNNETISLNWSTASETNNSHFVIHRSTDGNYFDKTYGYVRGMGNSSSLVNYSFTDEYPTDGANYYRLEQFDFDGKSTLTDIIVIYYQKEIQMYTHITGQKSIELANDDIQFLQAYDLSGKAINAYRVGNNIQFDSNSTGIVIVHLTDANGKVNASKIYL